VPAAQEPPPAAVLAALVASLRQELAEARAELGRARERIAELEARLRQNPRNSSKPPSSEGLGKPGGQDGHEGTTLAQVARPDREARHEPGCCGRCGAGLAGRPVTGVERGQVFDLPPVRVEVTGHQLIERECVCGARAKGQAPDGAAAPVQYGPRIAAIIIYLYIGQFLSKQRTAQALAELFGIPLSSGMVAALTARAAGRLDGFLDRVRGHITASEVAGFDKTGFRVAGTLHWVHCARTGKYALLMVHRRRGKQAIEAMGVLPDMLATQTHLYRSAALIGVSQTAARAGALMNKHNDLARRLLGRQDGYLRFTTDFRVSPDNNGTERDIRMTKLKQKVSGCLRTTTGARQFCVIRSYLSTATKHSLGFFDALVMLTEGQPWMPCAA
jgi:transposase